jgi:pectinacetylesterase
MRFRVVVAVVAVAGGLVACGDNSEEPILNPPRDVYESWVKIEPPGIVCGNNSQYKIFANFSAKSDNLVVVFEPGGACWDYDSCTGKNGIRGAANPDGLPDNHWELAQFISPFLSRFDDTSPSRDWNMVYVPYCTGDVHTGAKTAVYTSAGSPDVTFHHDGHAAVEQVVSWLDTNFTHVPKMLVTGCSAGGVGSIVNYRFLRNGVHSVEKAYLLDDSGPVFPSSGYSKPMHAMIRAAWNLDSLTPEMPAGFTLDDMGTVNTALADEFPNDRLATTYFQRDMNFSLYSYERFYNFPPKSEILRMWGADTDLLVAEYAQRQNLYYFLPYYRNVNDSHCTTLFTFAGSDIEDHNMTLERWVNDFVADRPVESMREAPVAGEDP